MAGAPLSDGAAAEAIAAEGLSAQSAPSASPLEPPRPPEPDDPDETAAAFAPDLDWTAVAEAIPADITALADCDELDAMALDARLRTVVRAMQQITGRWAVSSGSCSTGGSTRSCSSDPARATSESG